MKILCDGCGEFPKHCTCQPPKPPVKENTYQHKCSNCGCTFYGHKGLVVCGMCQKFPAPQPAAPEPAREMTCVECGGSGEIYTPMPFMGEPPTLEGCHVCGGTGSVPPTPQSAPAYRMIDGTPCKVTHIIDDKEQGHEFLVEPLTTVPTPQPDVQRVVEAAKRLVALDWCIGYELTESQYIELDTIKDELTAALDALINKQE